MSWRLRFPANYRARYYNATLQRFISEDPLEFGGGQTNLYGYVGDDPIDFTDPLGLHRYDDNKCADGQRGAGFGWVLGASGALGVGPNGGYGVSGTTSVGGGTFMGPGGRTQGTFGSAGGAGTDRGGLSNYPSNQSGTSNASWGAFAGVGGGSVFVTNAGNSTSLGGPFTSYLASIGIFGFELDYSNGTWVASVTVGKSTGLGLTRLQTNTFKTSCR